MSAGGRPAVSVVIVNFNGGGLLLECLARLLERTAVPIEILLVDNASSDGSAGEASKAFPSVRLIANSANVGFARASNQGIALARADCLLLLNPDLIVRERAVDTVHAYMAAHPEVGICGPRILLPSGRLDRPCRRSFKTPATYVHKALGLSSLFPGSRTFGRYYLSYLDERQTFEVDAVIGAFLMTRRSVIDRIGPLDERFFLYCEDEDFCLRAKRAGYKVVYLGEAVTVHHKSSSARQKPLRSLYEWHRSVLQFHRKNIAPEYGPLTNGLVYAGISVAFAARTAAALLRQRPAAGRPSRLMENAS
ncbi:MAG: glycosyltransferase family 2 protein [Acidobacteria bacterium]|nr:glycosyltransferase family 2 protein [Acidobacteriota bacterium]